MIELSHHDNTESSSTTSSRPDASNKDDVEMNGISLSSSRGQNEGRQGGQGESTSATGAHQGPQQQGDVPPEHDQDVYPSPTAHAAVSAPTNNTTTTRAQNRTAPSQRDDIVVSQLPPPSASIMAALTSDEYSARPSRESVLQRLSEALLRRSLTQVRTLLD
jgi:hypothetical protein